jgi:hypothetical protein
MVFRIRKDQFDAFRNNRRNSFVGEIAAGIQQNHPEKIATYDDNSVLDLCENYIRQSQFHGFYEKDEILQLSLILFEIGENRIQRPSVQKILDNDSLSNAERLKMLKNKYCKPRSDCTGNNKT